MPLVGLSTVIGGMGCSHGKGTRVNKQDKKYKFKLLNDDHRVDCFDNSNSLHGTESKQLKARSPHRPAKRHYTQRGR